MNSLVSARPALLVIAVVAVGLLWALRDLALLVGYAVLLAYALLPVVKAIERVHDRRGRHLPRGVVAGGVLLTLGVLVGWSVVLAIPRIGAESAHFASNAPELVARIVEDLRQRAAERGFNAWLDPVIDGVRAGAFGLVQDLGGTLARGAARLFGGIGNLLGLAVLPLLAFYLLAESEAVRRSALRLVPEQARTEIMRLGGAVDRALRSYVRGQAIVCLVTGASVGVALALLHHPAALLLGLLVGAAELVPYLGFLMAAIAIALAGLSVSPLQAAIGLLVYIVLNWTIGAFVTPRVMGRYLKMHPFVVTVSVLAGARLMGPAGALLVLPVVAAIQAIIGELAPTPPRASAAEGTATPVPGA